jgi:protein-S-isoprenylcysteine O-methyltransferase Ste14
VSDKPNEAPDTAGVVAPPPLIYAGALAAGLLAKTLFPTAFLPRKVARLVGLPLLGAGLLLFLSSLRTMRHAGTHVRPDKPTSSLVVEGPYRFTRNPIYLGFTLFYGGITVFANSLPSALLLPFVLVVMRRGVIEREERYLERIFGEEYLRYKARVRRWV